MEKLFLGIDTGTQGVRIAVCSDKGILRSSAQRGWNTDYPHLGWAEQQPETWWRAITEAMEECLGRLSAEERKNIVSGAVCATSSTAFPVREDGTPLYPAMMWMDARSKPQMKMINGTKHEMLQYCGGEVSFEWLVPKILWLRDREPAVYEACYRVVEQLDWINYQLTGVWCASKCNATCKWNYSDSAGGFSDEFFQTIGLSEYRDKMLTDVRKMGDPVGVIRPELARRFGLSESLLIVEGSIDAHTAMFGMNAIAERRMGVILGTSFAHMSQVSGRPEHISGIWGPYEHCMEEDKWLLESGQITAGGLVNWFRDTFHITPPDRGTNVYQWMSAAASEIPPGAEGLTVLDFFQGNRTPYKDPDAKGVIYGLNVKHTWKHIYRALLESVTFGSRNILENQIRQGYDVDLLIGCGGVTKDRFWMQLIADITGKGIAVNEEDQAGVMGCCVLSAVGSGMYNSFQEAADTMVRIKERYEPDWQQHKQYEEPFRRYLKLYGCLKEMMSE